MKTKTLNVGPVFVTLATLILGNVHTAIAQATAFSYQGSLQSGANPANGIYDFRFALYDALTVGNGVGSPLTNSATGVSNGLFIATLDFGSVFNGTNYWLEIAVRTNGNGSFSTLTPRQPILPTPQATYAANAGSAAMAGVAGSANSVSAANLTGTVADSQLSSNIVRLNIPNTTSQATGGVVVTSGFITSANVTNGGSGYTAAPTVTVVDVSGSNAVVVATVSAGSVVSLAVQNAGSQYSAGATLTIAPPPSNAYQTFTSGNVFNGVNTFTNGSNTFVGAFNGTFGNFSGGSMTLSSNLNLPTTTATAGVIYSGGATLVHAFGTNNFFAGAGAGNLTLTGNANVGVGVSALHNNTSGLYNTANGFWALINNTSGNYNTANGNQALSRNTTGSQNTGNGTGALLGNTTGNNNTANGDWALNLNTAGSNNAANGHQALNLNTVGSFNTASGDSALHNNTSGNSNIGLGYQAGSNLTTGSNNIEIGNPGVAGESSTIRIGTPGIHTNTFIAGVISGNGAALTNVSAATLSGMAPANFWQTGGNTGTSPINGNFLGTTDNQPLEFKANNTTGLRLESFSGTINVIAGYVAANAVMPGAFGATISGGGYSGSGNRADSFATVGGGYRNDALGALSTIGGGNFNTADGVISTVGGGFTNRAGGHYAAVLAGSQNNASGDNSAIGGGTNNVASGYGATVPGGSLNNATGDYSFAAGRRGKATHTGAFVWADSSDFDFPSTTNNSFAARSVNGARFVSAIDGSGNPTAGVSLAAGGGAWSSLSDRNAKENFSRVDARQILQRVASLPLTSWNYRSQEKSIRHIGPMAQDFFAAFQVGEDDKHISTIDADGVALAAIQGLIQRVEEKDAEIGQLKQRLEKIEQLLNQKLGEQK